MGRPNWIPPEPEKVEALAARGLTEEQIAHCLGISQETLIQKKKIYSEFSEAIKRGKAKGIGEIANRLYENAKNGNVVAQIFFLKCRAGWKEVEVREITGKDGRPVRIAPEVFDQFTIEELTLIRDGTADDKLLARFMASVNRGTSKDVDPLNEIRIVLVRPDGSEELLER